MKKLLLLLYTLKHLKPIQVWYQLYYRVRNKFWSYKPTSNVPNHQPLQWNNIFQNANSYSSNLQFRFLNIEHTFTNEIDWNYSEYGKLWTYNLNYFEFLNQIDASKDESLALIQDSAAQNQTHKDGYEPYPISLRILNWVKFLSRENIQDAAIEHQLFNDCQRLTKSLEYHLLANHLLENGFGLLFGAYYFQDKKLYQLAQKIINQQLEEQILPDGGHYELSPMYHQIILYRVLDSIHLIQQNNWKTDLLELLEHKAKTMLSWLQNMTFKNGDFPKFNDAANGIAPTSKELFDYADKLRISVQKTALSESGYRKLVNADFELFCDVGNIAPSYQPGHSHADNLNFVLNYKNQPIIVDTGISTYEKDANRQQERSTISHNTVLVNEENSSQVWSGFRVGKRANTVILEDQSDKIVAQHNGYRQFGIIHQRKFEISSKNIQITDQIIGDLVKNKIEGMLHFHPECKVSIQQENVIINDDLQLIFPKDTQLSLTDYEFAVGFNQRTQAKKIIYKMSNSNIPIIFHATDN